MNFFQHQDAARKRTRLLVGLLLAATLSLILITVFVVAVGFYIYASPQQTADYIQSPDYGFLQYFLDLITSEVGFWVTACVVTVVVAGAFYKWLEIRSGGKAVAEALGGTLVNPNTTELDERKILNVVEEMAIASGNPVPDVYVIDDAAINAFAAGYTRHDAVIGVTKGCIRYLSRDELQGVVAHEFSHIHNGDMRLNMRVIALLHGILLIGLIGHFIVRGSSFRSRKRSDGRAMLAGFALMAIGYGGTFFGSLIKAAVSRQREFLADASAVQFTRNPDGIAGALKKIGGHMEGSRLLAPNAETFSHLYFGQSMEPFFLSWQATHPPLADRIKRIEPRWDNQFITPEREKVAIYKEDYRGADVADLGQPNFGHAVVGAITGLALVEKVAEPSPASISAASHLIEGLPVQLYHACHEPYLARAVIYSLLLDRIDDGRQAQLAGLKANAHPVTYREMEALWPLVQAQSKAELLTLINLSMPALRRMSAPQYTVFKKNCLQLIQHDGKLDFLEWCVYRLVFSHLNREDGSLAMNLSQVKKPALVLLTALASYGKSVDTLVALNTGLQTLGFSMRQQFPEQLATIEQLDAALQRLKRLKPLQKPKLLKAVSATINADGVVTFEEQLLLNLLADLLDCPFPASE